MSADIGKILAHLGSHRESTATHLRYIARVLDGDYPSDPIVPLDEPFVDARGTIQNLVLGSFTSSAIISSKARTIRANHWHRTDWHFSYLVSGEILYYHCDVGSNDRLLDADNKKTKLIIQPGQMFFTPPRVAHAMAFAKDSVFLTFSKNVREHETHEEDVVRVPVIDSASVWPA
jgi:dTDP-4-dehydrorhamnose 3,5-epimerase-like enzyme